MNDIDELIGRALSQEDKALLASHQEPGYLAQAFGLLRGPLAWVMWLVYAVSTAAFVAGVACLWRLFEPGDAVAAIRWGVLALALFQVTMMCKNFMATRMESNRLLREIKRVELQVSLLRPRGVE